jgi:predicted glycosyltransferase involved in capsule biosynthesis
MSKLLIVIPYRNRQNHLEELIPHLVNKLSEQKILEYKIVIIEQNEGKLFNRGLLCNIGFYLNKDECDYVIFHDVDMICSTDYSFVNNPTSLLRHRSKTKKIYDNYFGGVSLFPKQDFILVNGFSNEYWGWGGEDDDLRLRCVLLKLKISSKNGICQDLELIPNKVNKKNNPNYSINTKKLNMLHKTKNLNLIKNDGLSNIDKYFLIKNISHNISYTLVSVII